MALLGYSRLVGTSTAPTSDSAFTKDTFSKNIISTTQPLATTKPPPPTTTTTTTTTSHNKSQPSITTSSSPITTTLKALYQTHLLLFSLLFSTLTLLLVRALSALQSLGYTLFLFCNLVLYRLLFCVKTITMETATLSWSIWDSRKARQIRKKIEFEFFVWILGPGGNLLCFLLWPGWIVLGVMVWAVSWVLSGSGVVGVSG